MTIKTNTTFTLATRAALGALVVGVLALSAAQAQCRPTHSSSKMTPTPLGNSVGALGSTGFTIAMDCNQLFGVTVAAQLADGDQLVVMVTTGQGTVRVGGIQMFGGVGQLVMASASSVSEAFPVTDLRSVQVYRNAASKKDGKILPRPQANQLLLQSTF